MGFSRATRIAWLPVVHIGLCELPVPRMGPNAARPAAPVIIRTGGLFGS
jgi:hypothetical protein